MRVPLSGSTAYCSMRSDCRVRDSWPKGRCRECLTGRPALKYRENDRHRNACRMRPRVDFDRTTLARIVVSLIRSRLTTTIFEVTMPMAALSFAGMLFISSSTLSSGGRHHEASTNTGTRNGLLWKTLSGLPALSETQAKSTNSLP